MRVKKNLFRKNNDNSVGTLTYQLNSIKEGRPARTRLKFVLGGEEINVAAYTLVHTCNRKISKLKAGLKAGLLIRIDLIRIRI
jgi:hypothetical protein